jgi:hypothetical protein
MYRSITFMSRVRPYSIMVSGGTFPDIAGSKMQTALFSLDL